MTGIIDNSTEIDIDLGLSTPRIDPSNIPEQFKLKAKVVPNPMIEEIEEELEAEEDFEPAEEEPKKSAFQIRKEEEREFYETLTDEEEKEAWNEGWRKGKLFKGLNKDGTPRPEISAKEFLARRKEIAPINNERTRTLAREKAETDKRNAALEKQVQELIAYNKTREEREVKHSQSQLEKMEEEAILEGDVERVKALRRQMADVEKTKFTFSEPTQPQQQPRISQDEVDLFKDWQAVNTWFVKDVKLQSYADKMFDELTAENPRLSTGQKLEMISEEVEQRFSDKINLTHQRKPISVASGVRGMRPAQAKTISYNEVPVEARAMCEGFIKRDKMNPDQAKKLRAEYVKEYSN